MLAVCKKDNLPTLRVGPVNFDMVLPIPDNGFNATIAAVANVPCMRKCLLFFIIKYFFADSDQRLKKIDVWSINKERIEESKSVER